jgi:hypothetical protein
MKKKNNNGERGHTPSRGAPCQYLAGKGPVREAEICPTAYERSRRAAVEWLIQKRTSAVIDSSQLPTKTNQENIRRQP